jgi:hypothetical protein
MPEYDSPKRHLPYPLQNALVFSRTTEDDTDCEPVSSFVWPEDSDEKVLIPFYLSLNEYNVLASTIDVGSDLAYGEDALRVVWLWLRNTRCAVDLCDMIVNCIHDSPYVMTAIIQELEEDVGFRDFIIELIGENSPGGGTGNVYEPWPTALTPDPLCNAATYIVSQLRTTFQAIYSDLETLTPEEVLQSLLGLFGWRSGPLYSLIGLLETNDETAMLAAFDEAAPDLICALIEAELDQAPVLDWIATTYPGLSVIGDALREGMQSAATEGKYSQWIAVGALIEAPECECVEPPGDIDLTVFGFSGRQDGIIPDTANSGVPFTVYSTAGPTGGSDQIACFYFSVPCVVTINSTTWTFCNYDSSAALYAWCDVALSPSNFGNYTVIRQSSGQTSLPIPWNQAANGVFFESVCGGAFEVNITLTII